MARFLLHTSTLNHKYILCRALGTLSSPQGKALLFDRHGNPEEVLRYINLDDGNSSVGCSPAMGNGSRFGFARPDAFTP